MTPRKYARKYNGHAGVIILPVPGRITCAEVVAAFGPDAQKRRNVVVFDARPETIEGTRYVKMAVVHVNSCGTDASDLADFAEGAARKLGIQLPPGFNPVQHYEPICFVKRPHAGSPRKPTVRRRGAPVGSGSIAAG